MAEVVRCRASHRYSRSVAAVTRRQVNRRLVSLGLRAACPSQSLRWHRELASSPETGICTVDLHDASQCPPRYIAASGTCRPVSNRLRRRVGTWFAPLQTSFFPPWPPTRSILSLHATIPSHHISHHHSDRCPVDLTCPHAGKVGTVSSNYPLFWKGQPNTRTVSLAICFESARASHQCKP